MACAMCLSMTVVGTVAPQVAVQAEETAAVELKEAPTETPTLQKDLGYEWYFIQYSEYTANSENTKSWMEKITSIKVNDAEPYTKVDNKFLMKEDTFRAYVNMVNITIGNKEFTKDTDDFTKLTSATAVGAEATTGGYKFLDVDNGVTKALVIANPQGALVDGEGKTVAEISKQQLKAQINEVIYAGSETLTTVGAEPYGVNPQEDKRTVKKAELTLTASMNRFQVTGTKFVKVIWKDGKKTEAEQWCTTWLAKDENKGKSSAEACAAFKADAAGFNGQTWDGKSDIAQQASLSQWLQVVEVTTANQGILMNRFSRTLSVPQLTVEEEANWFWAKTYAGDRYKFEDGTFKPDGNTDLSEVASYFNAAGFDFAQGAKAAAFNFFVNGITGYGKENNAPKLAFVFKTGDDGVSADRRFVVISGYAKAEGETAGTTDLEAGKGGYLINLDLAALNGGQGILVDVDPSIPEGVTPEPGGQGDLEDENVNVIVRVEVQPWTAVNVFPILD